MYSHTTVGTNDPERAQKFYDAVMATLGHECFFREGGYAGYGEPRGDQFWVMPPFDKADARPGNGVHIAFLARDRAQVDMFHAEALAHGGTDEGAPGLRPHYHANYYGAYVRDPDGNKLQAVCHGAE